VETGTQRRWDISPFDAERALDPSAWAAAKWGMSFVDAAAAVRLVCAVNPNGEGFVRCETPGTRPHRLRRGARRAVTQSVSGVEDRRVGVGEVVTAKVALAHLNGSSDYYTRLQRIK
jgi:hypothetical protein